MSPEPDWALLAGLLAERGRLTPDLTAADAAQALADLIEAGVLDGAGALTPDHPAPAVPADWQRWESILRAGWTLAGQVIETRRGLPRLEDLDVSWLGVHVPALPGALKPHLRTWDWWDRDRPASPVPHLGQHAKPPVLFPDGGAAAFPGAAAVPGVDAFPINGAGPQPGAEAFPGAGAVPGAEPPVAARPGVDEAPAEALPDEPPVAALPGGEGPGMETAAPESPFPPPPPPAPGLEQVDHEDAAGASPHEGRRSDRHLQTELKLKGGRTLLTGGFVAGRVHRLRVRIAAEKAPPGVLAAVGNFPAVAKRTVTLSVLVRVQGTDAPAVIRKLRLPATADTAWTTPVDLTLPAAGTRATVEIVVLHRNRAIQTALLSGPLLLTPTPGPGLTLEVDAVTPLDALPTRSPAQATLVVSIPEGGEPVVLDPKAAGITLDSAGILAAAAEVRRILNETFHEPPATLAEAAAPLTRLAVLGSTLGRVLAASGRDDLAAAAWVHVVMLGAADLPFELVYDHPLPDKDDEVPVCAPALAGATGCGATCPDRDRSDRVCPFGFWATNKVIERRVHAPGRDGTLAEPRVRLTDGALVATSARTDAADPTASQRIAAAVAGLVPTTKRAADWTALATDVRATPEPALLVLVTHTEAGGPLSTTLELGSQPFASHRVDAKLINPDKADPGPIVLSLGCDTDLLEAGFATWVQTLQAAKASVVVSALSPIPGRQVADFVEKLCAALRDVLAGPGPHRFGAALTAARRATIAAGGLLALALTSTGDGDIQLEGA